MILFLFEYRISPWARRLEQCCQYITFIIHDQTQLNQVCYFCLFIFFIFLFFFLFPMIPAFQNLLRSVMEKDPLQHMPKAKVQRAYHENTPV